MSRRAAGGWAAAFVAALVVAAAPAAEPPPLEVGLVAALVPLANDGREELALPFVVELAAGGLAGEASAPFQGELRVALRTRAGEERSAFVQPFALDRVGADGEPLAGLRLYGELRVAGGDLVLEATARDLASGAAGRAQLPIAVPAERGGGWLASPALFVDPSRGWRALRTSELPVSDLPFPFLDASGAVFLPAAEIAALAGEPIAAQALLAAPDGDAPFVAAELVDHADGSRRELPASLVALAPMAQPGLVAARLELGPVDRPGRYAVRLFTVAPDGRRSTPFAVGPTVRVEAAAPRAAATGVGAPIAVGEGSRALESAYLSALARVDGGVESAAAEIVRFERAVLAPRRGRLGELRAAQRRVVDQIASRDRLARHAIAYLHATAIELTHEQRDLWHYAQARSFLADLLRPGGRAATWADRDFAADTLALFDAAAALEVDSSHPLALLRATIQYEQRGLLEQATSTANRLLAVEPDNAHARLRAGVIQRRRGNYAAARNELGRIIESSAPDWVTELAYSELALVERALGRPDAARAVLRAGIERVPAQPLYLQLAFYLDEANQSSQSIAVVHRLPIGLDAGRPAARHLYALPPAAELDAVWRRVRARGDAALPALRAALGGGAGEAH